MLHRRLHSLDAPRAGISSGAILGRCGSHVNANVAMGEALLRFWSEENCGRAADSHRFSTGCGRYECVGMASFRLAFAAGGSFRPRC